MKEPTILEQILEHKRVEMAAAYASRPLEELRSQTLDLPRTRGFAGTLRKRAGEETAIIAEVKKGSPSKGIIRTDFDPLSIARCYQEHGAACLSVLTDSRFFYGQLAYLEQIRMLVDLPLLRKDFIIDPYQVYEARLAGADAILLIAAALDIGPLQELTALASELGLDVLLEVHDEGELEKAGSVPAALLGINNRNLSTFVTDLGVTERLAPLVPAGRLVVAESGIETIADIQRLKKAGASAFLIGESLMRHQDVGTKLSELLMRP